MIKILKESVILKASAFLVISMHAETAFFRDFLNPSAFMNEQAIVNAADDEGNTVLILAAQKGNSDLINFALERQADLNVQNKKGETALLDAFANKNYDIAQKLIVVGADVNISNSDGITPLIFALQQENSALIKQLLKAGADTHKPTLDKQFALNYALQTEKADLIALILNQGVPLGFDQTDEGKIALLIRQLDTLPLDSRKGLLRNIPIKIRTQIIS